MTSVSSLRSYYRRILYPQAISKASIGQGWPWMMHPICRLPYWSSVARGWTDQCESNVSLCRIGHTCVFQYCWMSCTIPFCGPACPLLRSAVFLPLTSDVSGYLSISSGQLRDPPSPRSRCQSQKPACPSCRHLCSAVVDGQWLSCQMPVLHKGGLWGSGHPPCGGRDRASYIIYGKPYSRPTI